MRQLYLPLEVGPVPTAIGLGPKERRHLVLVLRLGVGDEVPAVDAAGRRCVARVLDIGKDRLTAEVRREEEPPGAEEHGGAARAAACAAGGRVRLELFQCLPKGRKMDIIVRQATEAGAAAITPVRSARSVAGPSEGRTERWRRIAVEAVEQSGGRAPPEILPERDLGAVAADAAGGGLSVYFHEEPAGAEPLHRLVGRSVQRVRILIGPEGGLAPEELRALAAEGWRQGWLGPGVLRAETAAVVALGAVSVLALEKETWRAE